MKLKGQVALITGAARGIGRAIALRFHQEGAKIIATDLDNTGIEALAQEIKSSGGSACTLVMDVSRSSEVEGVVASILEEHRRIDILVNNAGIISFAPIFDLTEGDWERIFAVNARGVFLCAKSVMTHMKQQKSGKIINIASIAGKTGGLYAAHYVASKFAVIGFTQALAKELAPFQVNVNAICPGFIETEMLEKMESEQARYQGLNLDEVKKSYLQLTGWQRMGSVQDVANLAVFLASEEADYLSGQAINVCALAEFH